MGGLGNLLTQPSAPYAVGLFLAAQRTNLQPPPNDLPQGGASASILRSRVVQENYKVRGLVHFSAHTCLRWPSRVARKHGPDPLASGLCSSPAELWGIDCFRVGGYTIICLVLWKTRTLFSRRIAVAIHTGDHVLVNVAPFIGSVMRSEESIPCEVLEVDGIHVHVRAEPPYRGVSLWVLSSWVDGRLQQKRELLSTLGLAE